MYLCLIRSRHSLHIQGIFIRNLLSGTHIRSLIIFRNAQHCKINAALQADSFLSDGYQERFEKGEPQKQLSKEFVREWLMENGFQGKDGQKVPEMTPAIVQSISDRYIELFENITGEKFVKEDTSNIAERIEKNVMNFLSK